MVKAVAVKLSSRSQETASELVDDEVANTVSPAGEKMSKIAHKQDQLKKCSVTCKGCCKSYSLEVSN